MREARLELRAAAALLVGATELIAAGCGGADTKTVTQVRTQTNATPLTKAEYIAQADEICRASLKMQRPVNKKLDAAEDEADYQAAADLVEEKLDAIRDAQTRLDGLPKPSNGARVLHEIEDKRQEITGVGRRFVDALRDEDATRVNSLADELNAAQDELSAVDLGYGFKVCGQG